MDDNQKACLGFSLCGGIGPVTFKKLVAHNSSPHKAFYASESKLFTQINETQAKRLVAFRKRFNPEKEIEKMRKQHIWIITCIEKTYPKRLLELYDPPICLFGKGDISMFQFEKDTYIGIVGTRKPTSYGQQATKWISHTMSSQRIVIVSGMAIGIDTYAHQGAIEEKGRTIAVLGTPIDVIYPRQNVQLHDDIISEYGVVISEYPPGMSINQGTFVARNRIVAGLSQKIVVVEGAMQSGALITAKCALELGRDVYAVPGPITSELSRGPNFLIQNGAHVLTHPTVMLTEYQRQHSVNKENKPPLLTPMEEQLYTILSCESLFTDELAQKLHFPLSDILPTLSLLEVRGIITKQKDGRFSVEN